MHETTMRPEERRTDWRLGFESLDDETAVERLPLAGDLPEWLTGALVRVTPARFDVGDRRVRHWFDGLAMLNRFGFGGGRVSYKSRFLDTGAARAADRGRWVGRGFATDPCRSIFQRVQSIFSPDFTDNANVNLVRIGERYLAMTETPLPIEFDAETLATHGPVEWADRLTAHSTTAHPHHDRERGESVNYLTRFGPRSEYVLYGTPAGGLARRPIARMRVGRPAYMHSFGMSERHLILAEYPLRANPLALAFGNRPFIENYRWDGEGSTRFHVFERDGGAHVGTWDAGPFFSFHHVNSFERGGELIVDLIAYEDASAIDALYLEEDGPAGPKGPIAGGALRRYVLSLAANGGEARWEPLAGDAGMELPRIDYPRHNGHDYRYVYAVGVGDQWIDALVKVDVARGGLCEWRRTGCYPGEPVFVRRPDARSEDDGVVLSVVLDVAEGRSFLLVLDAGSFQEVARAEAPHHIPFGFHGQHFR